MKKLLLGLTAVAAGMVSFSAQAQRDNRHFEHNVLSVVNNDSVDIATIEKHMKENAPLSPNDNGLPRFTIVGKDHKFYLGIGAQFLGEAVYDFGDEMPSPYLFTPASITPSKPGNRSGLGFAWQTSSLYLNFVAMPGTDNQVGFFFKGNFTGNNNTFNVLHLRARYRGLNLGYTTSLFTDAAAEPMTIDFEGPNAYPYLTLFTASWQQKIAKNLTAAVGIESPTASMTYGDGAQEVKQRTPAIPLYIQYAWNDGASHARLSGLVRPMQYRNGVAHKNSTLTGLGVQLSGMSKIVGPLSANYNVVYGRGISSYLQDDNGLCIDAMATGDGHMKMVKSLGVTAGLTYAFTNKLSTNLVYSHLTNWYSDKMNPAEGSYKYGDYVAANLMYNINSFVSAGIEYDYGHRKSLQGNSLHTNRVQVQVAVTF